MCNNSFLSSWWRLHFGTVSNATSPIECMRTMFVSPSGVSYTLDSYLTLHHFLVLRICRTITHSCWQCIDKLLETLQDGVTLSDVYSTVVQFVEEQKLKDYFTKSGYGILLIGLSTPSILTRFATGLEFREQIAWSSVPSVLFALKKVVTL